MSEDFLKKLFIDDVKGSLYRGGGSAIARLQDKLFTENGVFKADEGYDGLREVTVLVEASGGAGSGDLIELEIMPETVVSYNNDMQAYVLPRPVYYNSQTPYIVAINGKAYMSNTFGANQGGATIVGNTMLFSYYGQEYGTFGIMCTHYTGLCTMVLDSEHFPVPSPITVRIYKLLSKIDATDFVDGFLTGEPYRDYAFEDDTIEGILDGTFYNQCVWSVKSQSAEYIDSGACNGSSLATIDCPNVRYIGEGALSYCRGLYYANLPLVEEIDNEAFNYCSGLKLLDFHALQYINSYAFVNCVTLKILIIRSESVCTLSSTDAFSTTPFDSSYNALEPGGILLVPRALIDAYWAETNWSAIINSGSNMIIAIEDVTVDGTITGEFGHNPNKIMYAGLYKELPEFGTAVMTRSWEALLNNEIVSVSEGGVQSLNSSLIDGKLILPDDGSITTINEGAFKDCSSLTSITIPESVTSIGNGAFRSCSGLTSVNITDGVTSIGGHTFNGCSSLTSVNIPDGVTSIDGYTFNGCSSLTSITIPEGVTSIGAYAFGECSSLTSITIPEEVTSIGFAAFDGCSSLTSITIPEGVTSIDQSAFYNCSSLTSITIPEGVTSIEKRVFYKCSSLASITLPNSLISIGTDAFRSCSALSSITIPAGVTNIDDAFRQCDLKTVTVLAETPPTISSGMFNNCSNLTAIEVPAVSVDAYKAATYWSDYSSYIVAIA